MCVIMVFEHCNDFILIKMLKRMCVFNDKLKIFNHPTEAKIPLINRTINKPAIHNNCYFSKVFCPNYV